MKKLFLSITLLLSGSFSFTTNHSSLDNFNYFTKELPASCINGLLPNVPAETKCDVGFDEDGNGFFRCSLTKEIYEKLLNQYHPEKVATDNTTEGEKTVLSEETANAQNGTEVPE